MNLENTIELQTTRYGFNFCASTGWVTRIKKHCFFANHSWHCFHIAHSWMILFTIIIIQLNVFNLHQWHLRVFLTSTVSSWYPCHGSAIWTQHGVASSVSPASIFKNLFQVQKSILDIYAYLESKHIEVLCNPLLCRKKCWFSITEDKLDSETF